MALPQLRRQLQLQHQHLITGDDDDAIVVHFSWVLNSIIKLPYSRLDLDEQ